jgi:hypothetical protein
MKNDWNPVKSDDPVSPRQIDKYFTVPEYSSANSIIFALVKTKIIITFEYSNISSITAHLPPYPAAQTLAYSVRSSLANDDDALL